MITLRGDAPKRIKLSEDGGHRTGVDFGTSTIATASNNELAIWKNWLQNQPNMKRKFAINRIWWMPLCENIIQKTTTRMVQSKRESTSGKQQEGADV